jgi:ribosomal protein S27AE
MPKLMVMEGPIKAQKTSCPKSGCGVWLTSHGNIVLILCLKVKTAKKGLLWSITLSHFLS